MDTRRMCPHCRAFITTKDRVCPYCNETVGPRAVDVRNTAAVIGGFIPHARFNTVLILLINFGLYAATVVFNMKNGASGLDLDPRVLYAFGAKVGLRFLDGQWWRLVTAGFLHGGLFHILMNSWVLFDLGANVEEIYGPSRMWVIYFCSSFFGFLVSAWWNPAVSIGASAGLCGLVGAMIALGVRHRNPAGDAIRTMYIRWAVYILLMGLLPFFNIDNAAHLGGLVAGFCVAYVAETPGRIGSPTERLWQVASWFCIILTVVSFLKMWLSFSHVAE
ncbi:MAG TPA: rhomboid family intramembrane serine protease [Bryobacteraceae bacterium]|nr:rhomboid family intramembrane serine protease [Bryobacteraceae bacterium]